MFFSSCVSCFKLNFVLLKAPKMASTVDPFDQQSCPSTEEFLAAKGQLQKCLEMLKAARNDNEKMASLLLFTHLMKNNESLAVDSGEVFRAIGPRFIVRLLNSKNVPDGCPKLMYKSLSLSILASFSSQELLSEPLIISSLFTITEVLTSGDGIAEAPDLFKDAAKVLQVFSTTQGGCQHLLENNCIPVVCRALVNDNPEMNSLFEVLKGVLLYLPLETWSLCESELNVLVGLLSKTFSECQDLEKFTTCDKLVVILSSLCGIENEKSKLGFEAAWMENIRTGLRDILQSRCKIAYKYSALQLATGMIELFGVEWCLASDSTQLDMSNTKFWLILLSIAKTEVKIILESCDAHEIEERSAVMIACYRILEKTIEFLITDNKGGWSFNNDLVLHLHATLLDSFDCIIKFLIQLDTTAKDNPEESSCFQRPIITATIRVLCAWLSEETNSLSDGVSKVLPILITWAEASLEEGTSSEASPSSHDCETGHEIISYLLPPLCHLSADEIFCAILVEKQAHILLAKFFNQLWLKQEREQQEYPSSLVTLCNVFLNMCVLEIELIKNSQVFQDILNCIMVSLPKMVADCVVLKAHFVLLGLLLFRHRCCLSRANLSAQETSFFNAAIDFLRQAQISICEGPQESNVFLVKQWDNISELWFLSTQNLVACTKGIMPVKRIMLSSSWVKETKLWLQSCKEDDGKSFTDIKSALLPIASLE